MRHVHLPNTDCLSALDTLLVNTRERRILSNSTYDGLDAAI